MSSQSLAARSLYRSSDGSAGCRAGIINLNVDSNKPLMDEEYISHHVGIGSDGVKVSAWIAGDNGNVYPVG